ncbi:ATP-dependent RNA helicase DbpA [Methylobacterium adhaesivum]|uniref:DEAD/DEAH box helicase family protein n=1 Tax=Methylobacterium adhaesivum TaxID=333297 RepID=A0ABT8BL92_9HYPH|nr:DEAD/DEAH box helicase [Methylobacterium adhaesivum]MDN3592065.1 DEAD/DEAH box helicase family protein [Methylobacterium adhaesivum]GJD31452.1 ATP-dependent RNA helicase DbpA [Methylobacterium adhaesivum]
MALTLRPYQEAACTSLFAYWAANPESNPLLVIPTGGGKSLILATLMRQFIDIEPTTRIVQITHVKELIEQNYKELIGMWPWAPAGIFSASLRRREASSQILFAGIQTVYNKTAKIGHVDLLMVDEAHLIPPDAKTMYGKFIAALKAINPNMLILGLTATPYRLDSGRLDEGDDKLFDSVAYEITIRDLIEMGYLVPLISKATASTISVKGVSRSGGEFNAKQLQLVVDDLEKTKAAVDEIVSYGHDRRSWLCFCSGVQHAHDVAAEIRSRGFTCETVHGDLTSGERDRIIRDFKAGKFKALTNANVLTTGFNDPRIDLLAMLRPTLSTSLYVQMVGRGTRCIGPDIESSIRNGKADCLVLDFAGNVRRHGPVDAVEVKKPGKGEGDAPVKECPSCHSLILAGLRECPDCGHEFERNVDEKLTATAAAVPIISKSTAQFVEVTERTFFRHDKPGGKPSVRVEYLCGLVVHKEWICPEHDGFARDRFAKFWRDHGGAEPTPPTIDATLDRVGELRETAEVRIRASGRYWEVCGRKLAAREMGVAA